MEGFEGIKIMKRAFYVIVALSIVYGWNAFAADIYLDKLSPTLDEWYNGLDRVCRGMPGGSAASDLACAQRNQVSSLLKKMGCWNIYPATNPGDTSYWKCRQ
jgi:hypothetical protein